MAYGDVQEAVDAAEIDTDVVEVEAIAIEPNEVAPLDLADRTKADLAAFDATAAGIADLRERYGRIVIDDPSDKAQVQVAQTAKTTLTRIRTSVEGRRKDLKAPALAYGKALDERAKGIIAEIAEIEAPIEEQLREIREARKAREAEEAAAYRQKMADRVALLATYGVELPLEQIEGWSDEDFEGASTEAREAFEAAEDKRIESERADREKREAEQKALDEEKAKLDAEKAELAAQRKEIEDAKNAIVDSRMERLRAVNAGGDREDIGSMTGEDFEILLGGETAKHETLERERAETRKREAEAKAEQERLTARREERMAKLHEVDGRVPEGLYNMSDEDFASALEDSRARHQERLDAEAAELERLKPQAQIVREMAELFGSIDTPIIDEPFQGRLHTALAAAEKTISDIATEMEGGAA